MFKGIYPVNLDTKGRLAIPTKLRPVLHDSCDGRLMVTTDPDGCLMLFTLPEWGKVEKQFEILPTLNTHVRAIKRLIIGHAMDCDMDGQGRISLSETLRQYANLEKQVVLVGQLTKFEIWDAKTWNESRDAITQDASLDDLKNSDPVLQNLVF